MTNLSGATRTKPEQVHYQDFGAYTLARIEK